MQQDRFKITPFNKEPHKCAHFEWFSVKSLPKETVPLLRTIINKIDKNISFSEE